MIHKKINLKEQFNVVEDVDLECLIIPNSNEININRKHKALLILPGGGYEFTSDREADPVAYKFLAHDISVFILHYKTKGLSYPSQLLQAAGAIAVIRKNAKEWNIDENQIYAMGFSAGGHLCGNLATINEDKEIISALNVTNEDIKVNGMILCYPVVTLKEFTHLGSRDNLLQNKLNNEMIEKLSIENRITKNTPPAFIWHTYNDDLVDVQNSLLLANALRKHNINFELHIFNDGPHGLSTADINSNYDTNTTHIKPSIAVWTNLCAEWMKRTL
jgi:acetyl esterase/lipase